jgi:trimeric autotransporter adhesin
MWDMDHHQKLEKILAQNAEILRLLVTMAEKGEEFMSSASQALIDLQNAVNTLVAGQTNLQAADAALDAALATLEAELSNENGVSPAAIEAAVAQIKTASAAVGTVVADLNTQVTKAGSTGSGITVVVSPATAELGQGQTLQFSASGDPSGYIWSLNPAAGEGSISTTGLYTAPTTGSGSVQVIATSASDSTKASSAQVSYAASNATAVLVTPPAAQVAQGTTAQFSAVVTGDSSNDVEWSLNPPTGAGTIDQTGLYTPPTTPGGSVQVIATSEANPAIAGNALVTY